MGPNNESEVWDPVLITESLGISEDLRMAMGHPEDEGSRGSTSCSFNFLNLKTLVFSCQFSKVFLQNTRAVLSFLNEFLQNKVVVLWRDRFTRKNCCKSKGHVMP